jgi:pimeloyl-ACP methyl ester carboxylesterase
METKQTREPWNKGKLVGQKPPLKLKDIWAIRIHLQNAHSVRDLALFKVHGLFADGSCWSEVIVRLQAAGLNATAVQNPLTTLPEAVASAQRVLVRQDGPTVLVGHSFSGMIVTEAGMHPNVSALVYVGLLNKSIFQPEGGRSGMIRGDFTCRKADAV